MKIAIIYDLTAAGGVQTCVLSLIKGLNKKGIKPVIFWDEAPNSELLNEAGVVADYIRLRLPIAPSFIKTLPNLFRYLLLNHSHKPTNPTIQITAPGPLLK